MRNNNIDPAILFGILAVVGVIYLLLFIIGIFYILTLQACLKAVPERHRQMSPGMAWLMLIPIFHIFWHFMVVIKIAGSCRNAFAEAQVADAGSCGFPVGMTTCIATCCEVVPIINLLAVPVALVSWIIYWVQVAGLKNRLRQLALPA